MECAAQTHGDPAAYLSAGALAVVVHGLARGESMDGAVQRALAQLAVRPGHEPVTEALRHALGAVRQGMPSPALVATLGTGHRAPETLAIGVYCALVGEDIRHGLLLAVNHDGPSDATGTVCGSLLGAMHGETALPPAWLAQLEGRATHAGTRRRLRDGDDPGPRPARPGRQHGGLAAALSEGLKPLVRAKEPRRCRVSLARVPCPSSGSFP